MTRDEVLERLGRMADEAGMDSMSFYGLSQPKLGEAKREQSDLLRAAAELIRAGGWRPIADAPEDASGNTYGKWSFRRHAFVWEEFCGTSKEAAIDFGFTHYLLKPEPPAREVENG